MSSFPQRPSHLEKVKELHNAVQNWTAHIPQNGPYVNLMFAFGFATLGEESTARHLLADARDALTEAIPSAVNEYDASPVVARLVRDFASQAFAYRIEQALAGQPHAGPLSGEVHEYLDNITTLADSRPINTAHKLATHIIDRLRVLSRILEPEEMIDPYAGWSKHGDALKKELADLHTIRDPAELADRIRKLHSEGVRGKPLKEVQFRVLHEALPLAVQVSEAFTMEMLAYVPESLKGMESLSKSPDIPSRQGELLDRALYFAARFNRADIVKKLVDEFTALVFGQADETRFKLVNFVAPQCIRGLKKLGLTHEIARFLTKLHSEVIRGESTTELRNKYQSKTETWAAALQTLVHIAGGWLHIERHDSAKPILEEARNELISSNGNSLLPKDYTGLARAYVTAVGQGSEESALEKMIELFKLMPRESITNTWTTAQYYSRFHLELVEDTVFAVSELVCENPWKGKINP